MTELEIAQSIADGTETSPQRVGNVMLYAIRITGTGTAYRQALDEFVYRPPENYLNDNFLARCNGLPVIWEHPEDNKLDSDEFASRVIGTVFLPYIQDSEVWAIAKIYDDDAIEEINKGGLSTSPTVIFSERQKRTELDGDTIIIEGLPSILDHVAICESGVWDKGGEPSGILTTTTEGDTMPDSLETAETPQEDVNLDSKIYELLLKMDERLTALEGAGASVETPAAPAEEAPIDAKPVADAEPAAAPVDDIPSRIAEVEKKVDAMTATPEAICDSDMEEIADTQAQAEEVAHAFGDSAVRAMAGETPMGYRKRVIRKYQSHSPAFKDADVDSINDKATLKAITSQVFADSMKAAKSPSLHTASGMPREIKRESMGRTTIEFVGGEAGAAFKQFRSPARAGRLGV